MKFINPGYKVKEDRNIFTIRKEEYDNLIEDTSEGEHSNKFKMKLKDLRRVEKTLKLTPSSRFKLTPRSARS